MFNRRFYSVYHSMPLDIKPTEIAAMVYYVMAHHSDLVLFLLERKSSYLRQLFEDAKGVEENICASRSIQDHVYCEDLHEEELEDYQYVLDSEQEDSKYRSDLEQQQECKYISEMDKCYLTFIDYYMDRLFYLRF